VGRFVALIAGALASGRAHVATAGGSVPASPSAWGWSKRDADGGLEPSWVPGGTRIGWLDDENLYLEPEASMAVAQELSMKQGEGLPVAGRTLRKRLSERGLLLSRDAARQTLTVRVTFDGARREVLHLHASTIVKGMCTAEGPDQPDQGGGTSVVEPVKRGIGRVPGQVPDADPTSYPTRESTGNIGIAEQLVGLGRSSDEIHTPPDFDESAPLLSGRVAISNPTTDPTKNPTREPGEEEDVFLGPLGEGEEEIRW
jgi:hypothetical protein